MIEIKNLCHAYKNADREVRAVDNVSMTVEKGKTTCIIGHTGSGKSTLIQHLNGLLKPTSGEVLLDGVNIFGKDVKMKDVRRKVGLVFQYPEYQLFEETVKADIAFGPKNMSLPQEEIDDRVIRYSALVGLDPAVLEKSPFELSGGQKRRVAIAGIMAMKPEILVLDEPAAGLDPEGRNNIFDAIDEYRKSENATVIIVSHSMEDMSERCDRIAVLCKGEMIAQGSTEEIYSDPQLLINAGLDVPEITRIAILLADRGYKSERPIYTVDQAVNFIMNFKNGGRRE